MNLGDNVAIKRKGIDANGIIKYEGTLNAIASEFVDMYTLDQHPHMEKELKECVKARLIGYMYGKVLKQLYYMRRKYCRMEMDSRQQMDLSHDFTELIADILSGDLVDEEVLNNGHV